MDRTPREPSRIPVRGSFALAVTLGGLAVLLGFRSPQGSAAQTTAVDDGTDSTAQALESSSPAEPSPSTDASPTAEPSPSAEATEAVTLVGDAVAIRWGDVQVSVVVEGDDIVDVAVLEMPDRDHHTAEISEYVAPVLREAAVAADSADIDVVSGATYTSLAYIESLQSALDQMAG